MRLRYRHYMKLTENELRNRLQKRKMHHVAMQEIMRVVAEQKSELRAERGKNHQHARMWEELMTPLKYELKVVRGLLKYHASEERRIALETYAEYLDTLVGKMTLKQHQKEATPYQLAKANNLPNNGVHWTDWVGASKKVRISALFNDIPYKLKAKKKLPFERTIPKALWATLHERLRTRTEKELEQALTQQRAADIGDNQDKRDKAHTKVSNITQALAWIANMKAGEALPVTWHGFF
jgi:hypothetical protein